MTDVTTAHASWEPHTARRTLSGKGVLLALAVLALLAASVLWLHSSRRYRGAIELSTAARIILSNTPFDVEPEVIAQAAAVGMTSVLDPYSSYLSPSELEMLTEETEGTYQGVGIAVRRRDGQIYIADVFPQTPAADAGLRPGDQIISIAGIASGDLRPGDMVDIVRGAESSPIDFVIQTPDGIRRTRTLIPGPIDINPFPLVGITRSGIGYIRWEHFSDGSADRLAALVEELRVEETVGLVLDLRGNPGGVVNEAVNAAALFLQPNSPVCTLVDAERSDSMTFRTGSALPIYQEPLIIVQDELSSSAAEIFAAALHDAGRAIIVGRRSFGKGWVQNVFPLSDGGALRLSTAYYLTPSGARLGDPRLAREQFDSLLLGGTWRGEGLEADVEVPREEEQLWSGLLSREQFITEYVTAHEEDWSATGVEDSTWMLRDLSRWIAKKGVSPDGAGAALLRALTEPDTESAHVKVPGGIVSELQRAVNDDHRILFQREGVGILRQVWEERLRHVDDPDPGELEALIDYDPFLAAARDLMEQPERFQSILAGVQASTSD